MAVKEKLKVKNQSSKVEKPVKTSKKAGVSVASFSVKGDKATTNLSEAIFGQKPNRSLLAQAARVYLSNQRSAQAKTKGRGEVSLTTAKPFNQKGTGNARHGAKSAPIFVGGGIAHGPNGLQNYKLELPKQMRKKVLVSALSAKAESGLLVVADLENVGTKTKQVALVLKKMGLKYPTALVSAKGSKLYKAARNIAGVKVISADQLTAYQVLAVKNIVLTQDAVNLLETRLA